MKGTYSGKTPSGEVCTLNFQATDGDSIYTAGSKTYTFKKAEFETSNYKYAKGNLMKTWVRYSAIGTTTAGLKQAYAPDIYFSFPFYDASKNHELRFRNLDVSNTESTCILNK